MEFFDVNPRISDAASDITPNDEAHAGFVKLMLPDGEIDFVGLPESDVSRLRRMDADGVQPRFDDIRTLGYTPSFDYCVELADAFLRKLPGGTPEPKSRRR